ncbi:MULTISPECIES: hypothetical protein [Acinetobacter calcoaceticus/baumannii complex]|uniref:hypothetical protein n=1 Tax=Acinetobacter calcoaceticus/baumannii complex TaxID=909768 RepID=UPI0004F51095|nr:MULTISPECIES: hypothetical protein [Acinetobacter calcoaceticus/baumannii complex]EKX0439336.1 hypothetical protein [Acinetobacter baumannii]MCE6123102.1 hypothetical protein [Acinetobacter baumannii]MCE6123113.1 hypothetical protein [Acinetobacter baumannii]MCE6141720.1 hypothetical protein [Acinetobacter baumannii]MCE6141730.1 hypothetical protein [Acinetobacter baumannii]
MNIFSGIFYGMVGALIIHFLSYAVHFVILRLRKIKEKKAYLIKFSCPCGGLFEPTGQVYLTYPTQKQRKCTKCGNCKGFF